jgi:hypothetical protein
VMQVGEERLQPGLKFVFPSDRGAQRSPPAKSFSERSRQGSPGSSYLPK